MTSPFELAFSSQGTEYWRDTTTIRITTVGIAEDIVGSAGTCALAQNYPNPFNPSTTIRYALPERSHVTITIFNALGQVVSTLVESEMEAGYHEVTFDASQLSSGIYLYRLTAGHFVQTRKMIVLR